MKVVLQSKFTIRQPVRQKLHLSSELHLLNRNPAKNSEELAERERGRATLAAAAGMLQWTIENEEEAVAGTGFLTVHRPADWFFASHY
jgi:hypothetical protein